MMGKYVSSLLHTYFDDGKISRGKWRRCHEETIFMMGKYHERIGKDIMWESF